MLTLSEVTLGVAGVLLLTVIAIESGGYFLLAVVQGKLPKTDLQRAFSRAGHAHAGVLVILSLVVQLYADAVDTDGFFGWWARYGVPWAAVLMSAGFFLSVLHRNAERPNRLIALVYAGSVSLALGVGSLGVALLTT